MTSLGSPSPFFLAGKKAYSIDRSLRFNGADDAYLARTITTTGNRKTFTFSGWIKRSNLTTSAVVRIFNCNISTNPSGTRGQRVTQLGFYTDDRIYAHAEDSSDQGETLSTAKYRDSSAWMHLLYVVDTTESAAADRIKVFVNGEQITLNFTNNVAQDADTETNLAGNVMSLGAIYFNGVLYKNSPFYLAEANFIDGQALTPSSFTETDVITGQLIPKKYIGSYGTNGFYLNFSDNSGATATTLGKDSSGNDNNFTPNNLSVYDSMPDTPTNNFAVMSPLTNYSGLSQGNLRFNNYNDSAGNRSTQATIAIPKSGKWYLEARYQEDYLHSIYMGLSQIQMNTAYLTVPTVYYDSSNGNIVATGESNVSGGGWYNIGSGNSVILSMAIDVDNNSVKFYKDNVLQGTIALPTLTSLQEYFFTWANSSGGSSSSLNNTFNFGADSTFQGQETSGGNTDANGIGDFKYAPPAGHLALCSANLSDPTILKPTKHFGSIKYTGDGTSSHSITNSATVDFTPDWVWIKRNAAEGHGIFDSMRGVTKRLRSDTNNKETTSSGVTAFVNNGFTLGTVFNINSSDYVSWNWNAGDADSKTFKVVVVSDSGNKYRFRNSADSATYAQSAVTLDLEEGGTYVFDWSDSTAQSHPIRFSTTSDGTHGGGSEYTTGVVKDDSAYKTTITVATSAPTLYYYCQNHSGMGGQANTNSTTGSTNFDGSTLSKVKKNLTAGFSIVRYVGTGSAETIGHGLGIAPKVVITKDHTFENNNGVGYSWVVMTTAIDGSLDYMYFNLQNAKTDSSLSAPTSTVFSISDSVTYSRSGEGKINYCFNEVEGFSKFGSYVGNGSTDGTFVYTGFRISYLIMKSSSHTSFWSVYDNQRDPNNVVRNVQYPNENQADGVADLVDFTANGFKLRHNSNTRNGSGRTYFYYAFAESPFKNARAR